MDELDSFDSIDETSAISEDELGLLKEIRQKKTESRQRSLLIYHPDGIRVVTLTDGESVIVGRASPADIAIRDSSLSRRHACFEMLDGEVWVEDLESTNGTWVAGRQVERAQLDPGSEAVLGRVVVAVHGPSSQIERRTGLQSHDCFMQELEAEVERARTFERTLTLLMVRGARQGQALSHWFPGLRNHLRPFDRLALYSNDTTEVLLPELGEERSLELARGLTRGDPPLCCGVALYPQHGGSAGVLAEAARQALIRASAESPVRLAKGHSVSHLAVGDDTGVVVQSVAMEEVLTTCRRLAASAIPVLICGETGAGKEVVARAIHEGGKRKTHPMICVNCGAIPDQLVESTLFGHEKGAFTGADQKSKGVFESADGGTVLLDEIGELPAAAQAALLRVLETKRITRVGSSKEIAVDVRVLAATHRDLEAMCRKGEFREDLYYRLNAMTLKIPPLRERVDEIEPLTLHFIRQANQANDCAVQGIDPAALELLKGYGWPGNVRELRNAIERAVVIAHRAVISVDDLPERVRDLQQAPDGDTPADGPGFRGGNADGDGTEPTGEEVDLKTAVERVEARVIRQTLHRTSWNRKETARLLGISLRTLAYKQQQYGIRRDRD